MNLEQAKEQMKKDAANGAKVLDRIFRGHVAQWYKLEISRIVITPDMFWSSNFGTQKGGLMKFGENVLMTKDAANQILPYTGVEIISKKTWADRTTATCPVLGIQSNNVIMAHGEAVVVNTLPSGDEKKSVVTVSYDVQAKLSNEVLGAINKHKLTPVAEVSSEHPDYPKYLAYKREVFSRWARLSQHAEQIVSSKLQTKILAQEAALGAFTEAEIKQGCILYVSRVEQNTDNPDVKKIALMNLAGITDDLYGSNSVAIEHNSDYDSKSQPDFEIVEEPDGPTEEDEYYLYLETMSSRIKQHPASGIIITRILQEEKDMSVITEIAKTVEKMSISYPDRVDLWTIAACCCLPEFEAQKERMQEVINEERADVIPQLSWFAKNLGKRYA